MNRENLQKFLTTDRYPRPLPFFESKQVFHEEFNFTGLGKSYLIHYSFDVNDLKGVYRSGLVSEKIFKFSKSTPDFDRSMEDLQLLSNRCMSCLDPPYFLLAQSSLVRRIEKKLSGEDIEVMAM